MEKWWGTSVNLVVEQDYHKLPALFLNSNFCHTYDMNTSFKKLNNIPKKWWEFITAVIRF